jgi:hypothetical protein
MVDHRGRILANMLPVGDAFGGIKAFKNLLYQMEKNQPMKQIAEGDTVLLLPLMYTGNSDFYETPAGSMPGGLIVAAGRCGSVSAYCSGRYPPALGACIYRIDANFAFCRLYDGRLSLCPLFLGCSMAISCRLGFRDRTLYIL